MSLVFKKNPYLTIMNNRDHKYGCLFTPNAVDEIDYSIRICARGNYCEVLHLDYPSNDLLFYPYM